MTKHKQPSISPPPNPQNKQQTKTGIEWRREHFNMQMKLRVNPLFHNCRAPAVVRPPSFGYSATRVTLLVILGLGCRMHLGNPSVASPVLLLPGAYCAPSLPTDGSGLAPPKGPALHSLQRSGVKAGSGGLRAGLHK